MPGCSATGPDSVMRSVVAPPGSIIDGRPLGNEISSAGQSQTPCGLASTFWRPARLAPVPAFEPPFAVQPPCVWMPIAWFVPSRITGEPELPPVVSAV